MGLNTFIITSSLLFFLTWGNHLLGFPTWLNPLFVILYMALITLLTQPKQKVSQKQPQGQKEKEPKQELEMATRVQEALLSTAPPQHPSVSIAKRCIPATNLGGDFYTFVDNAQTILSHKQTMPGVIEYTDSRENYLGIAIGDVAGHGVSSALVMALSAALFDKIGHTIQSPAEILKRANNDIHKFIQNSQISHVTAFYAKLELEKKELTFARAGHNPAMLQRFDGSIEELDTEGTFLGMFPDDTYQEKHIQLGSGDRLFFYTDGIIEMADASGDIFGEERFKDLLSENKDKSADKLMDIIFNAVHTFSASDQAKDDQTLVIVDIH